MSEAFPPNQPVTHLVDGVTFTTCYRPPRRQGKSNLPSELSVRTSGLPPQIEWEVVPEGAFDRLSKRIGLAKEVQTDDPAFDDHCYVSSDQHQFMTEYLGDPLKRLAIRDLLGMGFSKVSMSNGELAATWTGFDPQKHGRPELVEEAAARLVLLSRQLPEVPPEEDHLKRRRRRALWILWPTLIGWGCCLFLVGIWPPLRGGELLWTALPLMAPLYLAFAAFSYMLLSGTSRSHRAWGWLMLAALPAVPAGTLGVTLAVNALADDQPATEHRVPVIRKYTTRSKNTTNYYVVCPSWRGEGEEERFAVSAREYGLAREGKSWMVVTTRPGALGVEWIVEKRLEIE